MVRAVPPRERWIPAAGRLLKHDRRVAARLSPASSTTSRAACRWRVGAACLCVLRIATRRSLPLPRPQGTGPYCVRRLEGSRTANLQTLLLALLQGFSLVMHYKAITMLFTRGAPL